MIWIVLAFIFSNAFTGLYCYLKGLAKAMMSKNEMKEKDNDKEKKEA